MAKNEPRKTGSAIDFSISLRPITPTDDSFLAALYASTRTEELAQTNWSDEQKALFCRGQFDAQTMHYQVHYTGAAFDIVERDRIAIGRLYVARWEKEIRIIDITIAPEHRGKGAGEKLLRALQEEARTSGKTLSIHVERFNRALRLYERLGFKMAEDKGVYLLMEWGEMTISETGNRKPETGTGERQNF